MLLLFYCESNCLCADYEYWNTVLCNSQFLYDLFAFLSHHIYAYSITKHINSVQDIVARLM